MTPQEIAELRAELALAREHGAHLYRVLMFTPNSGVSEPCSCRNPQECAYAYFESLGAREHSLGSHNRPAAEIFTLKESTQK